MTGSSVPTWKAISRRLLFVIALLTTGAITTSLFRYFHHSSGGKLQPVGVYFWGVDSLHHVLAFWLATRRPRWKSFSFGLRAAMYLAAFSYGQMLFDAVQSAQTDPEVGYYLPGTKYDDYARPLLDLPAVLTLVVVFLPLAFFSGLSVATAAKPQAWRRHISLANLLGYTSLISLLLAWIRFLASPYAPRTAFSGMTPTQAVVDWISGYSVFLLVDVVTTLLLFWGMSKSWLLALLSFPITLLTKGAAVATLVVLLTGLTGQRPDGVFADEPLIMWSFIAGQTTTLWVAFAVARFLGARPSFSFNDVAESVTEGDTEIRPG